MKPMKSTAHNSCFTAAQIAAALGRSKRGVQKALASVPPAGELFKRGGQAAAWRIEQLPSAWRACLGELARQRGFHNGTHLLSDPGAPWMPQIAGAAVQLRELAEHCLADAQRLQRALAPSLSRLTGKYSAPSIETEARGLAEYRDIYGHSVSARHWRRLVDRTIARSGETQDFSRIEVFLADKLARRPQAAGAAGEQLQNLRAALSSVRRAGEPSAEETVYIWTQAFDSLQWLIDDDVSPRAAERSIFAALQGSGVRLACTPDALRKTFRRKLARWQEGGCKPSALTDGRATPRAGVRLELPDEDRQVLIARGVERGGRISQAWRHAQTEGELSPEIAGRYIANPASKSYVPSSVREAIRHDVAALKDIHHGPRQAKLNGAYIPRDYNDIGPGDWSQSDDCTLPVYFYVRTPAGISAVRGQFLPMVDVRTSLILGFALHGERNYNAAIIRSLIVRVHDEYGLPRKGFYFENGLWRRSRLLKGLAADEVKFEETETGLREFVQFAHARLPRAKIIEGVLGILQNEMEPMPGYIGRNEQIEKFERVQKQLSQARAGKIAYETFLLSRDEWVERLEAICQRFNNERQDGRLAGQSPREAYDSGFNYQTPLTRLPASCRYLLANHRRKEKVTKNGVRIVLGGDPYYFRSAATAPLIGREVLVWHDVEERPQSITITDLQRRNAVEVPRVDPLPSMTATAEQLSAAHAQAAAHLSHARTLYRIIQPRFARNMFGPVLVDAATVETGLQIAAGRDQVRAEQDHERQLTRRVAAAERAGGRRFHKAHSNPERKLQGLEMLQRADELERQEEAQPK
jgi:hypothetical protein